MYRRTLALLAKWTTVPSSGERDVAVWTALLYGTARVLDSSVGQLSLPALSKPPAAADRSAFSPRSPTVERCEQRVNLVLPRTDTAKMTASWRIRRLTPRRYPAAASPVRSPRTDWRLSWRRATMRSSARI